MIPGGYLDGEARKDLLDIARDGSVAHGLARRANAPVLLDDGMSCAQVARVLLRDDGTVRTDVPRQWPKFCDPVSDNFRIINPKNCRIAG